MIRVVTVPGLWEGTRLLDAPSAASYPSFDCASRGLAWSATATHRSRAGRLARSLPRAREQGHGNADTHARSCKDLAIRAGGASRSRARPRRRADLQKYGVPVVGVFPEEAEIQDQWLQGAPLRSARLLAAGAGPESRGGPLRRDGLRRRAALQRAGCCSRSGWPWGCRPPSPRALRVEPNAIGSQPWSSAFRLVPSTTSAIESGERRFQSVEARLVPQVEDTVDLGQMPVLVGLRIIRHGHEHRADVVPLEHDAIGPLECSSLLQLEITLDADVDPVTSRNEAARSSQFHGRLKPWQGPKRVCQRSRLHLSGRRAFAIGASSARVPPRNWLMRASWRPIAVPAALG